MAEDENLEDDGLEDLDIEDDDDEFDSEEGLSEGIDDEDDEDEGDDEEEEMGGESRLRRLFNRRNIIIISIIGLIVIGALVTMVMMSKKSEKDQAPTDFAAEEQKLFEDNTKNKGKSSQKKKRAKKVKYDFLFRQITGEQLAQVLRELSFKDIPFNVIQNGQQFDVEVDETRLEEAKNILAIKGLPTGAIKGYELFDDASNIGVTEFDKRIRLVRALSGEMEKAIMKFDAIDTAQVEIVMPEQRLFAVTQPPVTASILLRKAPDGKIDDELVYAIIQLVSNAVENLDPRNISVVDTKGRVLSTGVLDRILEQQRLAKLQNRKSGKSAVKRVGKGGVPVEPEMEDIIDWFQIKYKYESLLERKAMTQLEGVLPKGSFKVAVTLDLKEVKKSGPPDIERISASIVIDSNREDIELDAYTTKQIQDTVAGAIGYVRGRDTMTISRAEFNGSELPPQDTDKGPEKIVHEKESLKPKDLIKYWPIPALGYAALAVIFLFFKGSMGVAIKLKELLKREPKPEPIEEYREPIFEEPEPVEELFEAPEAFEEFEEIEEAPAPVYKGPTIEERVAELMTHIHESPESAGQLIEEWMQQANAPIQEPEALAEAEAEEEEFLNA